MAGPRGGGGDVHGAAAAARGASACPSPLDGVSVEGEPEDQADVLLYASVSEAMGSMRRAPSTGAEGEEPPPSALSEGWDEAEADYTFIGHAPKAWLESVWARLDEEPRADATAASPARFRSRERPTTAEVLRGLGLAAPDGQTVVVAAGPPRAGAAASAAPPRPAGHGRSQDASRPATVPGLDMSSVGTTAEGPIRRPATVPAAAPGRAADWPAEWGPHRAAAEPPSGSAGQLPEGLSAAEAGRGEARLPPISPARGGAADGAARGSDCQGGPAGPPLETTMDLPPSRARARDPLPRTRSAPGELRSPQGLRGAAGSQPRGRQAGPKADGHGSPYLIRPSRKARQPLKLKPVASQGRLGTAHVHHHQHLHYHMLLPPSTAAGTPVLSTEAVCLGGSDDVSAGTP